MSWCVDVCVVASQYHPVKREIVLKNKLKYCIITTILQTNHTCPKGILTQLSFVNFFLPAKIMRAICWCKSQKYGMLSSFDEYIFIGSYLSFSKLTSFDFFFLIVITNPFSICAYGLRMFPGFALSLVDFRCIAFLFCYIEIVFLFLSFLDICIAL